MNRRTIVIGIIVTVMGGAARPVYGWGAATHAYLAQEWGDDWGVLNLHEMYGAMLPDMFNLMFGDPHQPYLWNQTHYEFMKLVEKAGFGRRKALAYGFASHNEPWGADQAHFGYIAGRKALLAPGFEVELLTFLTLYGVPDAAQLAAALAPTLAESAVESAIDLLVAQNEEPHIGARMALAASSRGLFVPRLLCRAYAEDFAQYAGLTVAEAETILSETERQFRRYVQRYGILLSLPDPVEAMARQGAELAEQVLEDKYGVTVNVPVYLTRDALAAAIALVQDDYAAELADLLVTVEQQLEAHGIEPAALPW